MYGKFPCFHTYTWPDLEILETVKEILISEIACRITTFFILASANTV